MNTSAPRLISKPRPDLQAFEPDTYPVYELNPAANTIHMCPSPPSKLRRVQSLKTRDNPYQRPQKLSPTSPSNSLCCLLPAPTRNNASPQTPPVAPESLYSEMTPPRATRTTTAAPASPPSTPLAPTKMSLQRSRVRAFMPPPSFPQFSVEDTTSGSPFWARASLCHSTQRHSIFMSGDRVVKMTLYPLYNRQLLDEAEVMCALIGQPHCVQLCNVWMEGELVCLEMEAGLKTLYQIIHDQPKAISDDEFWNHAIDIALGLQEMSDRGVLHKDVKPHNIVECKDGYLFFIDFGQSLRVPFSLPSHDDMDSYGDGAYLAPEFASKKVTPAWDAFSYGMTCLEMIARVDMTAKGLREFLLNASSPEVFFSKFPQAQTHSPEVLDFIWKLTRPDPLERMTVAQVLSDCNLSERIQARKVTQMRATAGNSAELHRKIEACARSCSS
ncbi:Protein kinase domain [Pelomyxa schiedti]|nr:Protein kinase domain [Pelomyxa schiedti]